MSQQARRGKRRQPEYHEEEEQTVDDLAYAASFAIIPTVTNTVDPTTAAKTPETNNDKEEEDDKEDIDIEETDDDDSDDDSEDNHEDPAQDDKDNEDEDEEEDEEEDHDDLVKAIAAMEDDDVIEEQAEGGAGKPHKTQHEVDAYNAPIHELERHLQFRLTVEDAGDTTKSRQLQASDLKCAGAIKHHMVNDRTVVIESNPQVHGQPLNLLDEGTLLLIKNSNDASSTKNQSLIALGRILETFGPVTRPLYTIRLPEPVADTKPAEKKPQQEKAPSPDEEQETTNVENKPEGNEDAKIDANDHKIENKPEGNDDAKVDVNDHKIDDVESSSTNNGKVPEDHWGPNGKYTQLLQKASGNVAVYFVEDEAKLIDTDLILRNSGKGCDASNFYDEEVLNKDEMYYSDDEKERQAKSRRKGGGSKNQRQPPPQANASRQNVVPTGFHPSANTTPAGFYAAPPPVPQGFHPPTYPPVPQGFHPVAHAPMPPGFRPAAPPTAGPAAPYPYYSNQYPPPRGNPPNGGGPPPAYHY